MNSTDDGQLSVHLPATIGAVGDIVKTVIATYDDRDLFNIHINTQVVSRTFDLTMSAGDDMANELLQSIDQRLQALSTTQSADAAAIRERLSAIEMKVGGLAETIVTKSEFRGWQITILLSALLAAGSIIWGLTGAKVQKVLDDPASQSPPAAAPPSGKKP